MAALVIILAALAAASAAVLRRDDGRLDRLRIAGTALGARLVALALVSAASAATGRRIIVPDEGTYLGEARAGVAASGYYSHVVGVLFKMAGPSAWLPRALNVIAGTLAAVVVYELVRHLAGRHPAVVAGVAVALWPSLILWSVLVLKDSLVLLAIATALLGTVAAARGRAQGVVLLLASTAVLGRLRPYAYVVAAIALLLSLALQFCTTGLRRSTVTAAAVLGVGVLGIFLGQGFLGWQFVHSRATVEQVDFARTQGAEGDTGFARPGANSLGDVLAGAPRGLVFTMLGPAPWTSGSEARGLLLVELPLWYGALLAAALSLRRRAGWRGLLPWIPVMAFAGGIVVVLTVYEGNAGTALRLRAMVIPVVVGLASLRVAPLVFRERSED